MITDGRVAVDLKVGGIFNENRLAGMCDYLAKTEEDLALLLNFKHTGPEWQ